MSTRTAAAALVLIACAVVAPLIGLAAANASRPVIQSAQPVSSDPNAALEAMPAPPTTSRDVSSAFERLPIVDPAPRPFVEQYRTLIPADDEAAARLIGAAIGEVRVEPAAQGVTDRFLAVLLIDHGIDVGDLGDPFETDAFRSLETQAMAAMVPTPGNAIAINDLAVAMFAMSLSGFNLGGGFTYQGEPMVQGEELRRAATALLRSGAGRFQNDRWIAINHAFMAGLDLAGDPLPPATIASLQAYADSATTDVTARSLLANVHVGNDPVGGLDQAITVVQPLLADPDTELQGRLILGDALAFAADLRHRSSPFVARSLATRALTEFDKVIAASGDRAAYTGRATVLDLLGSAAGAVEAQRTANERSGPAAPSLLRLSQLEACAGQDDHAARDAADGLRLALATERGTVPQTRFLPLKPIGRGLGGYSIDADRAATLMPMERSGGGGVVLVTIDPFPRPTTCLSGVIETGPIVEASATQAWLSAIAIGDDKAAREALRTWIGTTPAGDEGDEPTTATDLLRVMELLAGDTLRADEEEPTSSLLELASRLPADIEGRVCSRLATATAQNGTKGDLLAGCQAEAAFRQGDAAAADRFIAPLVQPEEPGGQAEGTDTLKSGMLNELAGRLAVARERYESAATQGETGIAGLMRLGDLDLAEGDATGALDHYALALSAIRSMSTGDQALEIDPQEAAALRPVIDNNRGVAFLMTARTGDDAPPDCVAFTPACLEAAEAFDAAARGDPMNPVYLMNQAWVARLTGDEATAETKLEEALANGTPLVAPARNDLGVLAARRGDIDEARGHFTGAIMAQPHYDLATWNLGVLDSRQAGPMLMAGQAFLADATTRNGGLLNQELAFQPDERVYRVAVTGIQLEVARAPGTGAAIGAAAFGTIATIGAAAQLLGGLGGGDLQDTVGTVATDGVVRGGRRARSLGARLGLGGGARQWPFWLAWVPALVVLVVSVAWTASWMAPDAALTATLIGLIAAGLALVVHACGHLVVADRLGAAMQPSGWVPGLALGIVGMPFHVPAGPFLAESISTGDPRRDWWVSFAGVVANLAAAGFALLLYLAAPMPFLRILVATQLAVAAFALIPSHPLDGDRLSSQPIVLAMLGLAVAAASSAIAVGAI